MNRSTFYPECMKNRPKWVLWRLVEQDGKTKKLPHRIDGKWASSTNPDTWTDYQTAVKALEDSHGYFDGIGYMMDGTEIFVDLDHCTDGHRLSAFADNVLERFNDTFVERSQSGTGLHIFCMGKIAAAIKTKKAEMYCEKRFCALTGNAIFRNELKNKQPEIDILYRFLAKGRTPEQERPRTAPIQIGMTEQEVIEKAANSRDGDAFRALYDGNWESFSKDGSQSSSDFLFACKLYFWTAANRDMMENIFRQSGLFRNERKMRLAVNGAMKVGTAVYNGKKEG